VRKTGAEIVTVIHPSLEDHLLSLPTPDADDEYIFPTLAGRRASLLSKQFGDLMEQAQIERGVIRERTTYGGRSVSALSFHSLRHSCSSILASNGVSEELRMIIVGHSTRAMHAKYTHHELERLRDAISVLPTL
jgi:integrase